MMMAMTTEGGDPNDTCQEVIMIDPNNVRLDLYNKDGIETARMSLLSDPTVGVHYRVIGTSDDVHALGMTLLKIKIREIHDKQTQDTEDHDKAISGS